MAVEVLVQEPVSDRRREDVSSALPSLPREVVRHAHSLSCDARCVVFRADALQDTEFIDHRSIDFANVPTELTLHFAFRRFWVAVREGGGFQAAHRTGCGRSGATSAPHRSRRDVEERRVLGERRSFDLERRWREVEGRDWSMRL